MPPWRRQLGDPPRHPLGADAIRPTENNAASASHHTRRRCQSAPGMRTWGRRSDPAASSPSLLRAEKVRVQEGVGGVDKAAPPGGDTPLLLAVDGTLVGLISLRDAASERGPGADEASQWDSPIAPTGDHPRSPRFSSPTNWGLRRRRGRARRSRRCASCRIHAVVGWLATRPRRRAAADIGIAMALPGTDVAARS